MSTSFALPAEGAYPPVGLRVVSDHAAGYCFFNVIFHAGSLHDPPGKAGCAWLSAQSLLGGTAKRTRAQFMEALDLLGASLDISVGRETITIEGEVLSRHLAAFVSLVAEAVAEPSFDAEEVERLRRRTIAELNQVEDSDEALASLAQAVALWGTHPYGRAVRGTPTSLEGVSLEDLRAFHASHFGRANALVAAAGDITQQDAEVLTERILSRLPALSVAPVVVPSPPALTGVSVLLVDKGDRSQSQVVWSRPSLPAPHPHFLALAVANTALGGTFTARLMREIREKRGWSYGAYSSVVGERRIGAFSARYAPGLAETVPSVLLGFELMSDFAKNGISEDELAFCQSYLTNAFAFQLETAAKRLGSMLEVELSGRPPDWLHTFEDRVMAVTLDEANAAIRAHFDATAMALALVSTAADVKDSLRALSLIGDIDVVPASELWNRVGT